MSGEKEEVVQNFRSNYYQKLGSTTASAVEEKKNLRRLLSVDPLDMRKLQQFSQHLHVPNDLRLELWKLLLEISPYYQDATDYVRQQRLEHYTELAHTFGVLRMVSRDEPEYNLYKYVGMYLIEKRVYLLDFKQVCKLKEAVLCYDIVNAVHRMQLSECDTYWLTRNFTNLVLEKVHSEVTCLVENTYMNLQREDMGGQLCEHLHKMDAFDKIPYSEWFKNCFSKVLPDTTFVKLWDKVISGSTMVLVYVAVSLILINRRPILFMKTTDDILKIFTQIQIDTGDEAVRRGIEMWQRNGGKLTPSSARASPAVMSDRSPTPTSVHLSH